MAGVISERPGMPPQTTVGFSRSDGPDFKLNRRSLLAAGLGLLAAPLLGAEKPAPLLDMHVHLFGVGEGGTGCRMSQKIQDGLQFKFLVWALQLRHETRTLDEQYEFVLAEQLKGSGLTMAAI